MWSDIFYPDNPKRREQLIRKSQELQDLMKNNFRATNQLINTMNKHLCLSLSNISLNEKATLKENCDVMIECMHKIQAEVEKFDKELQEKLEPTQYEKLLNLSLSPSDCKAISVAFGGVCGVASLASLYLVGYLIKKRFFFTRVKDVSTKITVRSFMSVRLSVVFSGINMMVEAILGSIERGQLEAVLKEYDQALDEFRSASEEYQDNMTYVRVRIQIIEKEGMF